MPLAYDAYATHLRTKFADDIGELARLAQLGVAAGADVKRKTEKFDLTVDAVSKARKDFEAIKADLDRKTRKKKEQAVVALEQAQPNDGLTMEQLLDKAKVLVKQIEEKGEAATTERKQLEGVMQASIMLGMKIDPVAGKAGRDWYFKVDTVENPALVAHGRAAGMAEKDVAEMAVHHRNWLRQFVRDEIMTDQNHAEILFLRDLGIVGARTGQTPEQIMAKVIKELKTADPETKKAALRGDFTVDTATSAELDLIYKGMIGSAGQTNPGVNASSGVGQSPAPRTPAPAPNAVAPNTAGASPASTTSASPAPTAATAGPSATPEAPSAAPAAPSSQSAAPAAAPIAPAAPSAESAAPAAAPAAASAESAAPSATPTAPSAAGAAPATAAASPAPAPPSAAAAASPTPAAAAASSAPKDALSSGGASPAANVADASPAPDAAAASAAPATSPAPNAAVASPAPTEAPTVMPSAAPAGSDAAKAKDAKDKDAKDQDAKDAPTHTPDQSKAEIASVTSAPIDQGKGEPAAKLVIADPPELTLKTDTPDPIRLKNEVVVLTKAYLALDKREPAPTDEERKAALNSIKLKFEELRVAMVKARGETEDNHLTLARVKFEKFLGVKASHEWDQGTKCVEQMANEAKNLILVSKNQARVGAEHIDVALKALPEKVREQLGGKLGIPTNIGFAGAVTTDFNRLVDTLTGGSLVQKAQTLINFGEKFLAEELLKGSGAVYDRVATTLQNLKGDPGFVLADRLKEAEGKDAKKKYKILFSSPEFRTKLDDIEQKQNAHIDAERQAEATAAGEGQLTASKNPGENTVLRGAMDSKIPQQPVELLNETQLKFLSQQGQPAVDLTPFESEPDLERRRQLMVKALKAAGIHLSKAPGVMSVDAEGKPKLKGDGGVDATSINEDAVKAAEDQITIDNKHYIEGKLENIVDPKAIWIKKAVENHAPLKAGISGTTARFVGCAQMLGGSTHGAAVAMIGHLQAIEAHSFWEIVDAAGLGMTAGVYVPFDPNPGGMVKAGQEFAKNHMTGIELGPQDTAEKQELLLGTATGKKK